MTDQAKDAADIETYFSLYADAYARMGGRVSADDVGADIRGNMIPQVAALLRRRGDEAERPRNEGRQE